MNSQTPNTVWALMKVSARTQSGPHSDGAILAE